MRYYLLRAAIVALFFLLGCKTTPSAPNSGLIGIQQIEQIPIGSSFQTIERILGRPIEIENIEGSSNTVAWLYTDGQKQDRATLFFDKASGKLVVKLWNVENGDPEQPLASTLKRFPNAKFKKRELPWVADASHDETFLEDLKLGISIQYSQRRQEVFWIRWFQTKSK